MRDASGGSGNERSRQSLVHGQAAVGWTPGLEC
jgi:hypothetical protein